MFKTELEYTDVMIKESGAVKKSQMYSTNRRKLLW